MTETAWLLELSEVSGGRARRRYWAGSYWALFAQHAVRFCRREDAEQTRAWLISAGVTLAAAAVSHEHAWVPLVDGFAADLALAHEQVAQQEVSAK